MKIKHFFYGVAILVMASCTGSKTVATSNSTPSYYATNPDDAFEITKHATDKKYGYTEKNPILVGKKEGMGGPKEEQMFLNALKGPLGQDIGYRRLGSCCNFKTDNGYMGGGLLDKYEIIWEGQDEPVILYINMYDHGDMFIPEGFTVAND